MKKKSTNLKKNEGKSDIESTDPDPKIDSGNDQNPVANQSSSKYLLRSSSSASQDSHADPRHLKPSQPQKTKTTTTATPLSTTPGMVAGQVEGGPAAAKRSMVGEIIDQQEKEGDLVAWERAVGGVKKGRLRGAPYDPGFVVTGIPSTQSASQLSDTLDPHMLRR